MTLLDDAGAIFGIIGAILSAVAIWITILIYKKVENVENQRRSDQKVHFKKLIVNNVNEILRLYNIITTLSSRTTYTPEEIDEKTRELDQFFRKNKELIFNLIRDTKFYGSMLSVVDAPTVNMDEIVAKIKWLTDEYYILEYSAERNKRNWIGLGQELQNNRDFIERALSSLNTV